MDDDIKRIINEELVLWLYGIVKYDDVFGEPHEHRFCIRWWSKTLTPSVQTLIGAALSTKATYHRSTTGTHNNHN